MKITQTKKGKNLLQLTIKIDQIDYDKSLQKGLLDQRKKMNLPGFRVGKVPMSLVRQKYELAIKVEEINKILSGSLQKYITDEKILILGNPLPLEKKVDFINDTNYIFEFEIGVQPEINISKAEKLKLDYWIIKPSKKELDEHISSLQKRYGSVASVDVMNDGDMLNISLQELDSDNNVKSNGISNTTSILIDKVENKSIKKKILKLKKLDSIIIDIKKTFVNSTDLASMLNISKEKVSDINSNYLMKINDISRLNPAVINIDFFNKVCPDKKIKTKKEFTNFINDELSNKYIKESDRQLFNDAYRIFIENVEIDFPEDFLKRWLKQNLNKEVATSEFEKEFNNYLKYLSWQLIENHICLENNIKITNEHLENFTKSYVMQQMQMYGGVKMDNKEIGGIVKNILKNKKESEKMMNEVIIIEMVKYFKSKMKINKKTISLNEFIKLANNQK